jgi:hypothetical protein
MDISEVHESLYCSDNSHILFLKYVRAVSRDHIGFFDPTSTKKQRKLYQPRARLRYLTLSASSPSCDIVTLALEASLRMLFSYLK